MKSKTFIFILVLIIIIVSGEMNLSQAAEKSLLLKNANIIPVSGDNILGGDILIQGTQIKKVGKTWIITIEIDKQYIMDIRNIRIPP